MYNFGSFITENLIKEIGTIEVGVINGKLRKQADTSKKGLKAVGNQVARKIKNKQTNQSTADILELLDNNYGVLKKPLDYNNNTTEYRVFIESMISYADKKNTLNANRLKNSLKAVIFKPIFASVYGSNSLKTKKIKGFDKLLIDTGQTIKAIEVSINGN